MRACPFGKTELIGSDLLPYSSRDIVWGEPGNSGRMDVAPTGMNEPLVTESS